MVVIREALALPEKNSFSYPIKPSDIHALRQDLLDALFDLLRASSTTQKQKDFLLLHSHILVIEVISLFLADTLLNKGTQTHIQNYAPSFALQNQQAYTETDYMDKPQHDPLWKKTARCVRSHLLPNYIQILAPSDYKLRSPKENGKTFEQNSLIKAKFFSKKAKMVCIADDSGLEIDVLNKNLRVMDSTAISLAKESKIPIIVTNLNVKHSILNAIRGIGKFTKIS